MHKRSHSLTLILVASATAALAALPLPAVAKDPMAGRWKTLHTNAHGTWTFIWDISEGETYTTNITGPAPIPGELGTIKWGGGRWSVNATTGRQDAGTYFFDDANTMSTTGQGGPATWCRLDNFDNPLPGKGASLLQGKATGAARPDTGGSAGTSSGGLGTGSKLNNAWQNLKNKVSPLVPGALQQNLPSMMQSSSPDATAGSTNTGSGFTPTAPASGRGRMPWQKPGGGYVQWSKWK